MMLDQGPFHKIFSFLTFLIFLTLFSSCQQKEKTYSKEEIWEMAVKEDPNIKIIVATKDEPAPQCEDYGEGCIFGLTVEVQGLRAILVYFQSEKDALIAAQKIDAYYFHNWLFDDVKGEPVLENFVKKVFKNVKRVGVKTKTN